MNTYKVKRNYDGFVSENCPVNFGVKIGSFDCTANCKHNQNSKKEIHEGGFEILIIKCSERSQLKNDQEQLKIEL